MHAPETAAASPPYSVALDVDGYCRRWAGEVRPRCALELR